MKYVLKTDEESTMIVEQQDEGVDFHLKRASNTSISSSSAELMPTDTVDFEIEGTSRLVAITL